MTPSRALCVSGELVFTTMPGCTGHAQDATGFGAFSTSTKHIRQLPAIASFLEHILGRAFWFVISCRLTHGNSIYDDVSNCLFPRDWASTYLGTTLPAFSQAWMSAEPAVAIVSIYPEFPQVAHIPSIETFFPSKRPH